MIDPGRIPLFCFFTSMIVGFLFIRTSTRLVRAQVRWWPGNVVLGGVHVHHAVFGVVAMVLGGVLGLAVPVESTVWRGAAAAVFGVGTALVLDEFALILRLRDVYWSAEGRSSVDAVFMAAAVTGLLVIGIRPAGVDDFIEAAAQGGTEKWVYGVSLTAINLGLAIVAILKGKTLTGLFGLFFPVLLMVGAARLARPASPWARWRYSVSDDAGRRKLERATRRELRLRQPLARAGTRLSDLVAGRPDAS